MTLVKPMRTIPALVAVCILLGLLCGTPALAGPKKIRVVGSWSSLTLFKNFEKPFWTQTIPREMGVETSMTSLSQVKLKGPAVLRGMEMGLFDVVYTCADYVVPDSPALAGLDLPALATDIASARKVADAYWQVMETYLEKDFNVKLLSIIPYPAQVLFSTEKINGLSDLKGKKIRASGWTTSEFVSALGASGITLAFSEVPQALQRGIVTGAITGSLSGFSAGWGEVSDYVYPLPMGGWDYVIGTMRMDTWNSLSPADQAKLMDLVKTEMMEPAWQVTADETEQGLVCLSGKGDCRYGTPGKVAILPITEGDKDLARKILVDHVLPAWAKKVDKDVIGQWNAGVGKVVGLNAAH